MDKYSYIAYLKKIISENEELKFTSIEEAIYVIDDLWIGGGFYNGIRGVDHWALLDKDVKGKGVTWEDILNWGVVVVPETKTYISDMTHPILEEKLHYRRLPNDDNHIIGYKNNKDGIEI